LKTKTKEGEGEEGEGDITRRARGTLLILAAKWGGRGGIVPPGVPTSV